MITIGGRFIIKTTVAPDRYDLYELKEIKDGKRAGEKRETDVAYGTILERCFEKIHHLTVQESNFTDLDKFADKFSEIGFALTEEFAKKVGGLKATSPES